MFWREPQENENTRAERSHKSESEQSNHPAGSGTSSHRSWHRTRIDIPPPQEIKSIRCCCCCVRWRWSGSCAFKQQQHPSVNEHERPCQNARFAFAFKERPVPEIPHEASNLPSTTSQGARDSTINNDINHNNKLLHNW